MEKIRLQKAIAESGYCSRRKAEEWIDQGRVKVNGRVAKIGDKADTAKDIITIDGERLYFAKKREYRYIMLYKPRGYVTTMQDEQGRRCVADLLTGISERVYPIGRLDVNSEGILLFTNDGNFANAIMHPAREVNKLYRVTVRNDVTEDQIITLSTGIEIDGRMTAPAQVRVLDKSPDRTVLEIVIHEGRNRQIRKMCEAVGLEVGRLKRSAIGPLRLGMLRPGRWRDLTKEELKAIRTAIKGADNQAK